MIVLMHAGATEDEIRGVCDLIRSYQLEPLLLPGESMAIGIPSAIPSDIREPLASAITAFPAVNKVTHVSQPYKLASIDWARSPSTISVKDANIGPGTFTVMAGPCSIESYEQLRAAAVVVKRSGAKVLRGGAFKPRTSPYAFQGLAEEGLKMMHEVATELGLVTISEVMSSEQVAVAAEFIDILQIGARSMQNFPLLIEAGKSGKPVFLKRGPSATVDELLAAAEYVLSQDNANVILCERGVMPLDRTYTRNTLDLSVVPVLKDHTHLPVIVDPSHGTGVARYVAPMAKAALMAGADGVMVEMHPNPKEALSDGAQSLTLEQFSLLMGDLGKLASFCGRTI